MATKIIAESGDSAISVTEQDRSQIGKKPEVKNPPTLPTDAEIEARKKEVKAAAETISEGLFSDTTPGKKKPDAKPAEKPAEKPVEVPAGGTPPAEVPPKPAPKKKPAAKPAAQPSAEDIAERTARKVIDELAPKTDELPEGAEELTPEDQRHFKIFQAMGESDPKYKDLADKFVAFAKERYDYEKKWLKENPGKEFDPDAEEHEAFFKKQPQFDEEDYDDARVTMKARAIARDEIRKNLEPIEKRQQMERIQREVEPKLRRDVLNDTHEFVKGIAPDIAALLVDDKGNVDWSPANLAKAEAADPVAAEVLTASLQHELVPLLDTIHRTFTPDIGFTLDPKSPLHNRVVDEIRFFEESMTEAPPELKLRGGKEFVTIDQWGKLANQVRSSKVSQAVKEAKIKELDAKYWTVDINDIRSTITAGVAEKVKAKIERMNQMGAKKFGKPAASTPPPATEIPPKPAPKPAAKPAEKPTPPPSLGGGADMSSVTPPATGEKNFAEIATKSLFPT